MAQGGNTYQTIAKGLLAIMVDTEGRLHDDAAVAVVSPDLRRGRESEGDVPTTRCRNLWLRAPAPLRGAALAKQFAVGPHSNIQEYCASS